MYSIFTVQKIIPTYVTFREKMSKTFPTIILFLITHTIIIFLIANYFHFIYYDANCSRVVIYCLLFITVFKCWII